MHKGALTALALALLLATAASAASAGEAGSTAILFERNGDLYAISLDGSRTVRLTNTPVWGEFDPAASPDGRTIAYSRRRGYGRPSAIWVMNLDGTARTRLTSRSDFDPAWTPDGRAIYFTRVLVQADEGPSHSFHEACGSIFRIGADGRDIRLLTNPPWKDSFHSHDDPAVSPDGLRIAFTDANQCSGGTTSFALRVVDQDGRVTDDLSRLQGNAYPVLPLNASPSWSPDGERLVFGGNGSLYIAHRTGRGARRLTPKNLPVDFLFCDPSWSPDGRWIAFLGGRTHDLYVIGADGTGLRRLMKTAAREGSPSWLPRLPSR